MPPLTSRERVVRVLAGELPDRVPVLMQNFQNTAYLAGMTLREFCRSGAQMAEAQLAAGERFGYDVIDLENAPRRWPRRAAARSSIRNTSRRGCSGPCCVSLH